MWLSASSSSDDDNAVVVGEPNICVTSRMDDGTCLLYSNHCPVGIVPRFSQNSFVISSRKLVLTVEMNPMFLWRLMYTIKNTNERLFDEVRIRTATSYDMSKNPVVCVVPHTNRCYLTLLDAFNVVFADRYNTPDKVTKLLNALSDVVLRRYC